MHENVIWFSTIINSTAAPHKLQVFWLLVSYNVHVKIQRAMHLPKFVTRMVDTVTVQKYLKYISVLIFFNCKNNIPLFPLLGQTGSPTPKITLLVYPMLLFL